MDEIVNNLKSPAWWFSAFFIGIIASIVAGFAKDKIGEFFSRFSEKAKDKRRVKSERRAYIVEALSENEGFLIIEMVMVSTKIIMSLCFFILFLGSPVLVEVLDTWCKSVPEDFTCGWFPHHYYYLISLFIWLCSVWFSFKVSSTIPVTMDGYKAYLFKKGIDR